MHSLRKKTSSTRIHVPKQSKRKQILIHLSLTQHFGEESMKDHFFSGSASDVPFSVE